ncbi:MAG TPA: radical SAM protein [Desulfobacteraceae bacterium]|nr:radical SAM protein [Desulfobacteraceae bacterium]
MASAETNRYIRRIRREFPGVYDDMAWLSPGAAAEAEKERGKLLADIFNRPDSPAGWRFSDTKLFTHAISPGCALCGEGKWACLFINGICNANCFYCPSAQNDKGPPITSSVEFDTARDFAAYVNRFGIGGVGFSGGEPLLNYDRVTDYLSTLVTQAERPVHTWMYTNGILVTGDKLKGLRDCGLNEIRFDLSARDYKLDSLKKAVGIIPVVTVEIPAIPEDLEKTKPMLQELHEAGVNFLNLHQIRCTPFNAPKLIRRGYRFIRGPGVAVLDTEMAALTLIRHALDRNIPLPINYCSFTFRNQFQSAAARRRNAQLVKKNWEDVTQTGYIRSMSLSGEPNRIAAIRPFFDARGEQGTDWQVSMKKPEIFFPARLWPLEQRVEGLKLKLTYSASALRSKASRIYPFEDISLTEDKTVVIERDNRHPGILLEGDAVTAFAQGFLTRENPVSGCPVRLSGRLEDEISRFERFPRGLAPYL